jgi:hypothetical protein
VSGLVICLLVYLLSAYAIIKLCQRDEGYVEKGHLTSIFFPGINTLFTVILGLIALKETYDRSHKNGIFKCMSDALLRILNKL